MKARALALRRTLRFGVRIHFIVRETEDAAWAAAHDLIRHVTDEQIAQFHSYLDKGSDSVGQARMQALHGGSRDALEIRPKLWSGIELVRTGAGTALVGDPETVAARLDDYAAAGVDSIIGSGYPHLEEAYRVAELLFPSSICRTGWPPPCRHCARYLKAAQPRSGQPEVRIMPSLIDGSAVGSDKQC